MDELKTLWRNQTGVHAELDALIRPTAAGHDAFEHLATERRRVRQYQPWTYAFVVLLAAFFAAIVAAEGGFGHPTGWVGWALVSLSGLAVTYFMQSVNIPYEQFAYEQPTYSFLRDVQQALRRKRRHMVLGGTLQAALLTAGLSLLIFGSNLTGAGLGGLLTLLGVMGSMSGGMIGMMFLLYRLQYGEVEQRVETILAEGDSLDLV